MVRIMPTPGLPLGALDMEGLASRSHPVSACIGRSESRVHKELVV